MHMPRILVVDGDPTLCTWLEKQLRKDGCEAVVQTDADEAFALMAEEDFDGVLTDVQAQGMGGLALCERVRLNRPDVPVVVMAAEHNVATAVSALRAGAQDFLRKPLEATTVREGIRRAVEQRRGRRELRRLTRKRSERAPEGGLWGESARMRAIHEVLSQVADSEACVLFTGERGTGKEVAARELHARSRRRDGPFLTVNCAEVAERLLEIELFGSARTPSTMPHTGLFMQANGGTLFLDEIDSLPPALQGKLLRALKKRTVRPHGGAYDLPFDVRVVCATRHNLEPAVLEGRFREDLALHLGVVGLELPLLRERGDDVRVLAQRFVAYFSARTGKDVHGLSPAVLERLTAYGWPGNVSELRSCMERAVMLTAFDHLTVEDLPKKLHGYRQASAFISSENAADLITLEELERRYILQVLRLHKGCRRLTAETLGMDRKTLYRKLERYRGDDVLGKAPFSDVPFSDAPGVAAVKELPSQAEPQSQAA